MSGFFLAPSLVALRNSINKNFPKRDVSSDGWIGNASHQATVSEHNPCWTCTGYQYGIVRATDTDIDDNDAGRDLRLEILNSTIGHPAVWYVISNGIIYSRTYNFAARKYNGANQHDKHVHVSINKNEASAKNLSLILKSRSLPPATTSSDPLGKGDTVLSLWCLERARKGVDPISGACFGDARRIMAIARTLEPKLVTTEAAWYAAQTARVNASTKGYTAEVKVHLARQGELITYATKVIQAKAKLAQDGIVGVKTQAFLKTRGYTFKP